MSNVFKKLNGVINNIFSIGLKNNKTTLSSSYDSLKVDNMLVSHGFKVDSSVVNEATLNNPSYNEMISRHFHDLTIKNYSDGVTVSKTLHDQNSSVMLNPSYITSFYNTKNTVITNVIIKTSKTFTPRDDALNIFIADNQSILQDAYVLTDSQNLVAINNKDNFVFTNCMFDKITEANASYCFSVNFSLGEKNIAPSNIYPGVNNIEIPLYLYIYGCNPEDISVSIQYYNIYK